MKHLLSFLLLTILVSKSLQVTVKECLEDGLFCENCQNLVRCQGAKTGNFTKILRQSCHPQKCVKGVCTDSPEPICDGTADIRFPCQDVGVFPHPFYCDKYVVCANTRGLKAFLNTCPPGYQYRIATASCDKILKGNQCPEAEYPVPLCHELLQNEPLIEDKTIYYTCEHVHKKELYPVLRTCPHGQVYDVKKQCRQK